MKSAHTALEAPNKEKNLKHPFSNSYDAGVGPQEFQRDEAGYLKITSSLASRMTLSMLREQRRKRKLGRKRSNRYNARKREEKALLSAPVHPTLARDEALAVEEAAGLA